MRDRWMTRGVVALLFATCGDAVAQQSPMVARLPAVRAPRPSTLEARSDLVPVAYRSVESQIRSETQRYVYDLATALRPSIREEAAICLAESRYGGRREVKTVLAKAAIADPAPSVRAKCIELLMRLGYHDFEYMAYLQSTTLPGQAPTLVRAAAKEALAKLAPRGIDPLK